MPNEMERDESTLDNPQEENVTVSPDAVVEDVHTVMVEETDDGSTKITYTGGFPPEQRPDE